MSKTLKELERELYGADTVKSSKIKDNRIKPKVKHKNSGKAKGFKDPAYLEYVHSGLKKCLLCDSLDIEAHHLKDRRLSGRDDSKIVALCAEHHRGSKCSPHGAPDEFYSKLSKDDLMNIATASYELYKMNIE